MEGVSSEWLTGETAMPLPCADGYQSLQLHGHLSEHRLPLVNALPRWLAAPSMGSRVCGVPCTAFGYQRQTVNLPEVRTPAEDGEIVDDLLATLRPLQAAGSDVPRGVPSDSQSVRRDRYLCPFRSILGDRFSDRVLSHQHVPVALDHHRAWRIHAHHRNSVFLVVGRCVSLSKFSEFIASRPQRSCGFLDSLSSRGGCGNTEEQDREG